MRRVFILFSALLLVPALTGCGNGEPRDELTIAIESELRAEERSGQANLDFDSLVDGDWTRLALVCGASDAAIADALGFPWEQPRESGVRTGFAYVFATDDRVEQSFGPMTAAPFDDRVYVSSCDWAVDDPVTLLLFNRQDSVIRYELRETLIYALPEAWFPLSGQGTAFYGSRWE